MGKSYVGDIGTVIRVSTGVDLTNASATKFKVLKPGNTAPIEWLATPKSPATEGILEYTIIDGDFSAAGKYTLIADVVFTGGSRYSGEPAEFTIYNLFK